MSDAADPRYARPLDLEAMGMNEIRREIARYVGCVAVDGSCAPIVVDTILRVIVATAVAEVARLRALARTDATLALASLEEIARTTCEDEIDHDIVSRFCDRVRCALAQPTSAPVGRCTCPRTVAGGVVRDPACPVHDLFYRAPAPVKMGTERLAWFTDLVDDWAQRADALRGIDQGCDHARADTLEGCAIALRAALGAGAPQQEQINEAHRKIEQAPWYRAAYEGVSVGNALDGGAPSPAEVEPDAPLRGQVIGTTCHPSGDTILVRLEGCCVGDIPERVVLSAERLRARLASEPEPVGALHPVARRVEAAAPVLASLLANALVGRSRATAISRADLERLREFVQDADYIAAAASNPEQPRRIEVSVRRAPPIDLEWDDPEPEQPAPDALIVRSTAEGFRDQHGYEWVMADPPQPASPSPTHERRVEGWLQRDHDVGTSAFYTDAWFAETGQNPYSPLNQPPLERLSLVINDASPTHEETT